MPTYAVLGATGSTGQEILKLLLQSPKNTVNAYVRSKVKLLKLLPKYVDNNNLHVYEGALNDITVMADCISNTSAVFSALGSTVLRMPPIVSWLPAAAYAIKTSPQASRRSFS